jgi:hypothetical protein
MHIYISTHHYKYTHVYTTLMIISEILNRIDLEIHKVGHQERLVVDGDVAFN